jgi:hypothetical protein
LPHDPTERRRHPRMIKERIARVDFMNSLCLF